MKELDPLLIPLEGTYIIEANAGTGKTYAISNIFLRMLLEKGIDVENILIVSFTEAATNELRHRIRKRLLEALDSLINPPSDPFIKKLREKIEDLQRAVEQLRRSIRNLDRLHISTIHGFCRKVISDNSFESGTLLDTRLIGDQQFIKQEIISDFWRDYIYQESPLFIDFLRKNGFDPENGLSLIDQYLIRPYIKLLPEDTELKDSTFLELQYNELFKELAYMWIRHKDEIKGLIFSKKGLNKKVYSKKNINAWLGYIDELLNNSNVEFAKGEIIKRLLDADIRHPFFEKIGLFFKIHTQLNIFYKEKLIYLKKRLIEYVEQGLKKRKIEKNIISFDDLIRLVHKAILEQDLLVDALRRRFLVAMIDEFQDTDPVQYEIFKKIFDTDGYALYLIGDPKQSIYSFRGADIFTYIKASKEITSKFTLKENWRSYPTLIEITNQIFAKERPFFYKDILFLPSRPAPEADVKPILLDGVPEPCLKIWTFNGKETTKTKAKEDISKAVAEEISKLIQLSEEGRLLIGDIPLKASDIAVLVRRNFEADLIQKELSLLHIPTIIYSTTNIFDSRESREMRILLTGIYMCNREGYLRAALGTDIIGINAEQMELMNEQEWEEYLKRFREYRDIWEREGFICMFRKLLNREKVIPRLMRFEDGERRCTNLLHLMEVIHIADQEHSLGMEGIIRWLDSQKGESISKAEEYQLRVESDESAVRVITIHRSKGLEFPIVFIPFAWDTIDKRRFSKIPTIFRSPKDHSFILDLGTEQEKEHTELAFQESLAEDLRLIYVALTRAKNCCYLIYDNSDKNSSALSYLFSKDIHNTFKTMAEYVSIKPLPQPSGGWVFKRKKEELCYKPFSGQIDSSWRITSFSSLVSNKFYIEDVQDVDSGEVEIEEEEIASVPDIFSFPKGAKAGIFFHDLLEHLDFRDKEENIKEMISEKLIQHGFDTEWTDIVFENIKELLRIQLDPEIEGLTLSKLSLKERISEMEFYFPIKKVQAKELEQFLREWNLIERGDGIPYEIEQLRFDPVEGFMRGFIDMVFLWKNRFFIIDWKSNFLGDKKEDYHIRNLEKEMKKEFYFLQLLIYTLAVDQYLKTKIKDYSYEKDFGKVYYIFLRGISEEKGAEYGIFRYRPDPKLIEGLKDLLLLRS